MTREALLRTGRAKLVLALLAAVIAAALAISGYGTSAARAQSSPGCEGPWGPGNWPPACWQPYADTSPFNTPLPADPEIVSNSEKITDRIFSVRDPSKPFDDPTQGIARVGRPQHLVANEAGTAGEPTYYSRPSDPNFRLHCEGDPFGRPDGKCPIQGMVIDIPAGAGIEEPITGSDRHLTVVHQATGVEHNLWQVKAYDEAGPNPKKAVTETIPTGLSNGPGVIHDLYFSWGGRLDLHGLGLVDPKDQPHGWPGDATAAHVGSLAGRVRAEELAAGHIDHALAIGVDCVSKEVVYPARGQARACSEITKDAIPLSNENAPPTGTRLRLNMTQDQINGLNIDPWKKTILRALKKFGAIVTETGTQNYFAIEAEAGVQYKTYGSTDKWWDFGQALDANGRTNWEFYTPPTGGTEYVAKLYNDGNDGKNQTEIDWDAQVWENMEVVDPEVSRDKVAPTVAKVAPASGSTGVSPSKNVSAVFKEAMEEGTVNGTTFHLKKSGATTAVSASVDYNPVARRATLNPSRDLRPGATYVATVEGTSSGVKDLSGNPLASDKVWKFKVRR